MPRPSIANGTISATASFISPATWLLITSVQPAQLREFHDTPVHGHMGVARTHTALSTYYYWPRMHKSVITYVTSCSVCQQNRATHEAPAGLARPLPVPSHPYAVWGLDFVMMPPNHEGKNCCVVFVCHKSKMVHTFAATATGDKDNPLSAAAVARIYFDHIFKLYGLCDAIVSDRDSRFVSAFWREIHKLCGTSLHMSTAFHPQSDGLTKRANRTVITTLRCILADIGGDWAAHLPAVDIGNLTHLLSLLRQSVSEIRVLNTVLRTRYYT